MFRSIAAHPMVRVLARPRLRNLLLGSLAASVGDGLAVVAVPWLALELGRRAGIADGLAVGAAAAAGYLTGLPIALAVGLGRLRIDPRRVQLADALLRGACLTLIGALAWTGSIGWWALVGLLGASAVLHSAAMGARRVLAAGLALPDERMAVNSLLSTQVTVASWTIGPALGGLLTAWGGPAPVIVADGLSFVPLVFALVSLGRSSVEPVEPEEPEAAGPRPRAASGWAVLRRRPAVAGLAAVALLVDIVYFPVDVALPIHADLLGGAGTLGLLWTGFGAGAIAGSLLPGVLSRIRPSRFLVGALIGWSTALACVAISPTVGLTVVAFTFGGLAWGPFTPVMYSVFMDGLDPDEQQPVLTLWTALGFAIAPVGLALGGPLVALTGTRGTMGLSAGVNLVLAGLAALLLVRGRTPAPADRRGG
jgi:MFS family permease